MATGTTNMAPRQEGTIGYLTLLLFVTLFTIVFHLNGEPLAVGGISISNLFVLLFIFGLFANDRLFRQFPGYFVIPVLLLLAAAALQAFRGNLSVIVFSVQGIIFMLLPYAVVRYRLEKVCLYFLFAYVGTSQLYLMAINGGALPYDDLGGFFVSRRTVHSLAFAFLAILVMTYIRSPVRAVMFFGLVFLLLLLSQARGAAILFGVSVLVFGGQVIPSHARLLAGITGILTVGLSVALSPQLVAHFEVVLSLTGGSSTGYRVYLFEILVSEFDRYWLFGISEDEVQYLLADRFTSGRLYQEFALDNAFVHFAMKFGAVSLAMLVVVALRLVATRQPYAVFFVGWMLLDDVLGSGLGWFFLGLVLVLANQSTGSVLSRRSG